MSDNAWGGRQRASDPLELEFVTGLCELSDTILRTGPAPAISTLNR